MTREKSEVFPWDVDLLALEILWVLRKGPMSQNEISHETKRSINAVRRRISLLEKLNLVKVHRTSTGFQVELTEKGKAIADHVDMIRTVLVELEWFLS